MGRADAAKREADIAAKLAAEQKQRVADARAQDEEKAERRRTGAGCLDWRGNSPPLVDYVKENARNPDSFQAVKTAMLPIDKNGHHEVIMQYRSQNGFGGMNVEMIGATVDPDTC